MVGWHHRLNGHEFEQAPGDSSEGQGSLACCKEGLQRGGHDLMTKQQQHMSVLCRPVFPRGVPGSRRASS